jgi:hypothetical protein
MRTTSLRLSLRAMLIASLSVVVAAGALTYSGCCIWQMRYVSDEEKIRNVVSRIVSVMMQGKDRHYHMAVRTDQGYVEYPESKIVPYASVEDFLKENENCCSVGLRSGLEHIPRTFVRRLVGAVSDFVVVKYKRQFVDAEGTLHSEYVTAQIAVDACGIPVWNDGWII